MTDRRKRQNKKRSLRNFRRSVKEKLQRRKRWTISVGLKKWRGSAKEMKGIDNMSSSMDLTISVSLRTLETVVYKDLPLPSTSSNRGLLL